MQDSTALRDDILAARVTAAGANSTFKVYTGTSPGVSVTATGTLLSTLTAVVFGTPSGGTVTFTATADSSVAASGVPGYVRHATSGGTALTDYTAGVGSGEFSFSADPALGGTDTLTSGTLTAGNA